MKFLHNSQIISEKSLKFDWQNIGFQYGDGLFETIIVRDGKVQHLGEHQKRLSNGLQKLAFSGVEKLTEKWKSDSIFQIF